MATASYVQAARPLICTTPLGKDALLAVGWSGTEGVSRLFHFHLDVRAERKKPVPFDQLLGQPVLVQLELAGGKTQRYFHGICSRVTQGDSDATFTDYRLDVVPKLWLFTRRAQSRIFQQISVPDILRKVLDGLDVSFELQGTFHPRDYCVQYRETDFNFASRLMEEEGIYYFFKHSSGGHQMVLANTPQCHPDLGKPITYKSLGHAAVQPEDFIFEFAKSQELASGKVTLWDHTFELPHKHLEAEQQIQESVPVGQVTHKLKTGDNAKLEIYDWPGEYAQRFDGVNPGGGERPADVQKVFEDNKRTVGIRMQQEAAPSVELRGASHCRQMASGYKFALATIPSDQYTQPIKADGSYVLTVVTHAARMGADYRSGDSESFTYSNSFTAIPAGLPYRPQRVTPKPVVPGSQTAVVVGPPGEEIFTDKYGRIKVQFHWDRQGKNNADSSCWLRVATFSAGRQWGAMCIPRTGQEVVVAFLEGDPDQPIVVGSVFNPDQPPPYKLPDEKTKSYFKSNSSPGGEGYNEIRFEDKKGQEEIFIHAQRNIDIRAKSSMNLASEGNTLNLIIGGMSKDGKPIGDSKTQVFKDSHQLVGGDSRAMVAGQASEIVSGDAFHWFKSSHKTEVGNVELVKAPEIDFEAKDVFAVKAAKVIVEATSKIVLQVGGNHIVIDSAGVTILGTLVKINSGPGAVEPYKPPALGTTDIATQAKEPEKPKPAARAKSGKKSSP